MDSQPAPAPSQRLTIVVVLVAVASLIWPIISLPAMAVVLIATLSSSGRSARIMGWVGGVLVTVATVRFTIELAVPSIVAAGQHSAEEKAVSRLREILWAEQRAIELKIADGDQDGRAEFVPMKALLSSGPPILKPGQYQPFDAVSGSYRVEGYVLRVFLKNANGGFVDDNAAAQSDDAEKFFVAYAWPMARGEVGRRTFMLLADETICETAGAYEGSIKTPEGGAGPVATGDCGKGGDGNEWRRWLGNKQRVPLVNNEAPQPR